MNLTNYKDSEWYKEQQEWDKNHKYSIKIGNFLFWLADSKYEWWTNIFYTLYTKYSNKYL